MDKMINFLQSLEYLGDFTPLLDITPFFAMIYLTMVKEATTDYD